MSIQVGMIGTSHGYAIRLPVVGISGVGSRGRRRAKPAGFGQQNTIAAVTERVCTVRHIYRSRLNNQSGISCFGVPPSPGINRIESVEEHITGNITTSPVPSGRINKPELTTGRTAKRRLDYAIVVIILKLRFAENSLHSVQFGNRAKGENGARCWCVFFDLTGVPEFEPFLRRPLAWRCPIHNPDRLKRAFETLSARCKMPPCGPEQKPYAMAFGRWDSRFVSWSIKAAALEVLATLLDSPEKMADTNNSEPPAVWLAREYMARNFSNPELTLSDIASATHLSTAHFGRLFRQTVSITPLSYLRSLRIEQSRFLLERTNRRISEVAMEVGFKDPLHFSRVFRQIVGFSPRSYRQQHLAGKK